MEPEKWTSTLDSVGSAADNIDALSTAGRETIVKANDTLESYAKLADENKDEIHALLSDMRASLDNINRLAGNSNELVLQSNQEIINVMGDFSKSLKEYDKAGKNLNRFLERIADHPSQLFLGGPPPEKPLE